MPTLNTNGATVTKTVADFEFYTTIRHSAAFPLAPVTLAISDTGYLDISDELKGVAVTITTSALGNTLITGEGADTIFTNSGHDSISAGGGNDFINGGTGNDVLFGGAGDDTIIGGYDNDTILGGDGNDFLQASAGLMTIDGGAGNDRIIGGTTGSATGGDGYDIYQTTTYDISMLSLSNFEELQTDGNSLFATAAQLSSFSKIVSDSETSKVYLNIVGAGLADMSSSLFGRSVDLRCSGLGNAVRTSNGNDYIQVFSGSSNIISGAGNDTVYGGTGNDKLYGGDGDDTLGGGKGADVLQGGAGNDIIDGGAGSDTVDFSDHTADMVLALNSATGAIATANGVAEDSVLNIENILGGSGNDTFAGGLVDNLIRGGAGNDIIDGGAGFDKLYGDSGDDTLYGGVGSNLLDGGDGNDTLFGGINDDQATGGAGNDTFVVSTGSDVFDGGKGTDTLDFSKLTNLGVNASVDAGVYSGYGATVVFSSVEVLTGTDGNDVLTGGATISDRLTGGAGNDWLIGGGGNDKLQGGLGDDVINGGTGNDLMDGGDGNDRFIISTGVDVVHGKSGFDVLDFSGFASVGSELNLTTGIFVQGGNQTTFTSIEGVIGTSGDDAITGSALRDMSLSGGDGNDVLATGAGIDVLTGGSGADSFQFAFAAGTDTVTDFSHADDSFRFVASTFLNADGSALAAGALAADYVVISGSDTLPSSPGSAHGYLLATATGLYWDNDGAGANAAVQIAVINSTTDLALNDFLFV